MYSVTVFTDFSAAHMLKNYKGKCESLHGHNWNVEVTAGAGKLNNAGMVMDFKDLKKEVNKFIDQLDHKFLNDLKPFKKNNPTSENIAYYIYKGLGPVCKRYKVKLIKVTVWETPASGATYAG